MTLAGGTALEINAHPDRLDLRHRGSVVDPTAFVTRQGRCPHSPAPSELRHGFCRCGRWCGSAQDRVVRGPVRRRHSHFRLSRGHCRGDDEGMQKMSDEEWRAFVSHGTRTGKLSMECGCRSFQ